MLRVWQFYDRKIHARFKAITKLIRLDDESIYPNNLISGRLRPPVLTSVDMLYRSYLWGYSCPVGLDLKLESWDQCHKADIKCSRRCSSMAEGVNVYVHPSESKTDSPVILSDQSPMAWLARLGLSSRNGAYTYSVHTGIVISFRV